MSDNIQHIDVDSDEWENTPKALRDQVKKVQKALAAATQTITEYRGKETEQALSGVLTGFKNPNRVKRDLIDEGIDPLDTEAVKTWIETNGDDYARGSAPAANSQEAAPAAANPYAPFEAVAGYAQPADQSKFEVAFGGITDDMDGKAVAEHFRRMDI